MDSSRSFDEDASECLICCNTFGGENRAVFLPCCRKTVCGCCIESIPVMATEPDRRCPFCRSFVPFDEIHEDFKSQEFGQRTTAKGQRVNYPFDKAACRVCSRMSKFSDLYICLSCDPGQFDKGFQFSNDQIHKTALCVSCMMSHRQVLSHTGESLTVFIADKLDALGDRCAVLFPGHQRAPLIPAFLFYLIRSTMIRLQGIPVGLPKWLSESSKTFMRFAEGSNFRGAQLRHCTELFIKSYWSLVYTVVALIPGIIEFDEIRMILESLDQVAHIAVILPFFSRDSTVGNEMAAEMTAWEDCLPIFEGIQQRLQKYDCHHLAEARIKLIFLMLDIIRNWFLGIKADFVQKLFAEETRIFHEMLCDPNTSVQTQRTLREYQEKLAQMVQSFDEQHLDKLYSLAREERRAVFEDYDTAY